MSKIFALFFLIFASYFIKADNSTNPGLKFAISDKGLKTIKDEILPNYINDKVKNLSSFNTSEHIIFVGNVYIETINNTMVFHNVTGQHLQIKFVNTSTILLNIKNITGVVDFNYTIKSNFYSNKGPGHVILSDIELDVTGDIYSIENAIVKGKFFPALNISSIVVKNIDVDVKFDNIGGLEKLITTILSSIKYKFTDLIANEFNTTITPSINQDIQAILSTIPLHKEYNGLVFDYSLSESPHIINNTLEISFNATLSSPDSKDKYINKNYTIPKVNSTSSDIDLYMNENLIDSALFYLWAGNKLKFYLNHTSFPDIALNTNSFSMIFPELKTYYKNKTGNDSLPMDLNFTSNKAPLLVLQNNQSKIEIGLDINFIVNLNESFKETALIGHSNITIDYNLFINNGTIGLDISSINVESFNITDDIVGVKDIDEVITELNSIINNLALATINQKIQDYLNTKKIPQIGEICLNKTDAYSHPGYYQVGNSPFINHNSTPPVNKTNTSLAFLEESYNN